MHQCQAPLRRAARETSLPEHRCECRSGPTVVRKFCRRSVESGLVNSDTRASGHSRNHKDKDSLLLLIQTKLERSTTSRRDLSLLVDIREAVATLQGRRDRTPATRRETTHPDAPAKLLRVAANSHHRLDQHR